MGDYAEKERRQEIARACVIGAHRFDELEKNVRETREKVFNGLSGLPKIMMWGFGIMITLLITIAALSGSTRVETAKTQQRLEDHIDWGLQMQEKNEEIIDVLEEAVHDNSGND